MAKNEKEATNVAKEPRVIEVKEENKNLLKSLQRSIELITLQHENLLDKKRIVMSAILVESGIALDDSQFGLNENYDLEEVIKEQ